MSCDPIIIGIRLNISSKLFELVTSNSVSGFDCRVLHTMVYFGQYGRLSYQQLGFLSYCEKSGYTGRGQTDGRGAIYLSG